MSDDQLKERLAKELPEFGRLLSKHREYDSQLKELLKSSFLAPQQQREVTELKKLKLKMKDQMEQILIQHRKAS